MSKKPPIFNVADVELRESPVPIPPELEEKYKGYRMGFIGQAIGAQKLGVIACPPGGPESAHQIINSGAGELRYLDVSTKMTPELVDYPDSNKFGLLAELAGEGGKKEMFRFLGRADRSLGYFDDEPAD